MGEGCIAIAIPENPAALQEFLYAPDTVDFVVRGAETVEQLLKGEERIVVTQTLAGRYIICYAKEKDFKALIASFGSSFVSSASLVLGQFGRPALEAANIIQAQQQPYLSLLGSGVLIGIVDSGIDYTQSVFRYEDGTSKIRFLYDQTIPGSPPEGFYLGTEYTNDQINAALKAPDPYQIVPQKDESGHGTYLASVIAGRPLENFTGAVPDSEIIAVKVRDARPFYRKYFCVPENQKYAFESSAVMIGVEYIVKKARDLKRPAVICLALGTSFGGHDGYTLFEEYLDGISNLNGICLCTAVGNESQSRHHTQGIISTKGETHNIDLRVGDNAGDIFISIWNSISDRMAVTIRSPTGELVGRVPPKSGTVSETNLILERTAVMVEYFFPLEETGGQLTVVKLLQAAPGIWTLILDGDIILDGTFHAWLPITGFISPDVEFLAATPYYTVTVPSTMIGSVAAGAYDSNQGTLYADSSWGPNRLGQNTPDVSAPGVSVEGYFPTGPGTMNGTCAAVAITAGACAQMLEWGVVKGNDPALSTYQIRAYLVRGCDRKEDTKYPNPQWGYGTLNVLQTFQYMREL